LTAVIPICNIQLLTRALCVIFVSHTRKCMVCCEYAGSFMESETEAHSSAKSQPIKMKTETGSNDISEHRLEYSAGQFVEQSRSHTGDRLYKCYVCDEVFSELGSLNEHLQVHTGDTSYKCSLCDRSFINSNHLQSHNRHVHSHDRRYDCPYCGMLFKTNIGLKNHTHIHTGAEHFWCSDQLQTHLLKSHDEGTCLASHIY